MPSAALGPDLVKLFDAPDAVYLTGVTVEQAREVMHYCNGLSAKPTPQEATDMAARLFDFYSHQKFRSAEAMTATAAAVAALLTEISTYAAQRAVHPLTGLPRKLEFLSVASASKLLQEEEARYQRIAANARYIVSQREELEKRRAEDAAFEANRGTAEDRAKRVQALMASLKEKSTHAA